MFCPQTPQGISSDILAQFRGSHQLLRQSYSLFTPIADEIVDVRPQLRSLTRDCLDRIVNPLVIAVHFAFPFAWSFR